MSSNPESRQQDDPSQRKLHRKGNIFRHPAVVVLSAVGAVALVGVVYSASRSGSAPNRSGAVTTESVQKQLHDEEIELADKNTACYDFGNPTVISTSSASDGIREAEISIPIRDHPNDGMPNIMGTVGGKQSVVVWRTGYSAISANVQDAVQDNVTTPGAERNSRKYNLELEVGTNTPGLRIEKVYYAADMNLTIDGHHETVRGQRQCGAISFDVGENGAITDLISVPVEPPNTEVELVKYPYPIDTSPHGM